VRSAKDYFDEIPEIKVAQDMLKLAEHILESKEADFDPSQFVDHYEQAVIEMLRKKQAGVPLPKEKPSAPAQNVINLMEALRRSIDPDGKAAAKPKSKKRIEGQREMLLPISGKGQKEKPAARSAKQRKAG
jgi:DNA end-binding protein Ku